MPECSTSVSTEAQDPSNQDTSDHCPLHHENGVEEEHKQGGDGNGNENVPEEEDDEEDADFNPFLKETHSVEASSNLSSEVEDLDADVADSRENPDADCAMDSKDKHRDVVEDCHTSGNAEDGGEMVMQTTLPSGEVCEKRSDTNHVMTAAKESVLITQSENESLCDKENGSMSLIDVSNGTGPKKPPIDMDTDGAISMRTRARYSLASFSLDELETFLQETDDEDDLQNVDDEEEYKKFLAAVLRGDDPQNLQGNANADEEDDVNDADFELELEEALESEPEEVEERRTTRRRSQKKASSERSRKQSGRFNRPLRPLLPFASIGSFSAFDGKNLAPNIVPSYMPPVNSGYTYGFTPHQIGQLHCLIHEHVQLLIQVFSISVLEPGKSQIASEVKGLVVEMLQKRNQVLAQRMVPYPSFCFSPPYIHPSAVYGLHEILPPNGSKKNVQQEFPSTSHRELHSDLRHAHLTDVQAGSSQNPKCTSWVPYVCGPVLSVMDVAPLRLVENFIDEVSSAVRAYERSQIEIGFETLQRKEPLFSLHNSACSAESDGQGEIENTPPDSSGMLSSSSSSQMSKKSMAATLLEKAKNQPVALVPKEIAELSQRFWPLFNPALYPHKPPPAPLANRVLFTDTEDELLALGLMEYNNDWKAIQKRFLPCKSRHQIFVRQKNRASSKAPENPIKAVRRMKNSPLTSEEIARIEAGLKKFKLDWISIWGFFVPYRDPSLLPRQWRIACGTQKSYKSDANKKAKRRLYELRRKSSKATLLPGHSSSEKEGDSTDNAIEGTNSGENHLGKEDEAYFPEGLFGDSRPDNNVSSSFPTCLPTEEGSQARKQKDNPRFGDIHPQVFSKSPAASRSSNSQVVLRPYRARRPDNARQVKLAPGLPPVNLPASVRVMSQSDFKSSQAVASAKVSGDASRMARLVVGNGAPCARSMTNTGFSPPPKPGMGQSNPGNNSNASDQQQNHSEVVTDKRVAERGDSGLQMHPLLYQSPQVGHLPYYQPNSSTSTSSPFTFLSGKQPKLSLSLFHNPRHIRDAVNFLSNSSKPQENASSSGVDFHPLLQRTDDDVDTNSAAHPAAGLPSITESKQKRALVPNPSASISKPLLDGDSSASSTKVASRSGKVNELDLDIHLSCEPKNQKDGQCSTGRSLSSPVHEIVESESAKSCSKNGDSVPHGISDEFDSGDTQLVPLRTKGSRKVSDIVRDESLPEIVMEEEELSDSEEEFGDSVEFECEEMADSEGDSMSDSEPIVDLPNEEVPLDEMDDDTDDGGLVNIEDDCGGNTCSTSPIGLESDEKEVNNAKPNIPSLNLNFCPPISPHSVPNNAKACYEFGPFGKTATFAQNQLPASSKGSSRVQNSAKDTPSKNPRKRICRSNSNSSIAASAEGSNTNLSPKSDMKLENVTSKD